MVMARLSQASSSSGVLEDCTEAAEHVLWQRLLAGWGWSRGGRHQLDIQVTPWGGDCRGGGGHLVQVAGQH